MMNIINESLQEFSITNQVGYEKEEDSQFSFYGKQLISFLDEGCDCFSLDMDFVSK